MSKETTETIDIEGKSMKDLTTDVWKDLVYIGLASKLWKAYKNNFMGSKNKRNKVDMTKKAKSFGSKYRSLKNKKIKGTNMTLGQFLGKDK